jgi:hypothetical protein
MAFDTDLHKRDRSRGTLFIIIGVCVAFASVYAWIFIAQRPRVADGAITSIEAVPLHTEIGDGGAPGEGVGGGVEKSDEMLVWVHFHMNNLTEDVPLFETKQQATLTLLDGQEQFATAQNAIEVGKVRTLTGIKQVQGRLVPDTLTLDPGKSTEGVALFVFPVTPKVWNIRRAFSVSISFQYQRDLAMQDPHPPVSDMLPKIVK